MIRRGTVAAVLAAVVGATAGSARADEPGDEPAGGGVSFTPKSVAGALGLSFGSGRGSSTAYRLRAGASLELLPPGERLDVDLLLPLGFGFQDHSDEIQGVHIAATSLWVELVPSAQVAWAATEDLHIVGAGGAGLAWHRTEAEVAFQGVVADWRFAFVLHFSGGVRYALSDTVSLTADPLGVDVYFLDGSSVLFTMMVGAEVRL